jgi:creatinine amidohydrolase
MEKEAELSQEIVHLADLTWEAFRDRVPSRTDLVFLPVGTLEAHGAIPLGTDTLLPLRLAERLAPRFGALIAPPVPYGVTNSLLPYPGSTTVSSKTFEAYLFEAAAGLVDAGFRRVVLLNGHGGQSREVGSVVGRLWNEKKAFAAAVEWWGLVEEVSREVYGEHTPAHAGVEETALVLAVAPQLVDLSRARSIRRAARRQGLMARPFPASVILEREEKDGDGAPILDPERAGQFFEKTILALAALLEELFEGWRELR